MSSVVIDTPASIEEVLALPSVGYDQRANLPHRPGLYYVVIEGQTVVYVGCTDVSLRQRWQRHHHADRLTVARNVALHYFLMGPGNELARAEETAINRFWPLLNQHGRDRIGTVTRSEPLIRSGQVLIKEAAAELNVSEWAIWKAIQLGRIKNTERIGPMHTIPIAEWERYKRERRGRGRPRKAP